jgi:hypothetical protein
MGARRVYKLKNKQIAKETPQHDALSVRCVSVEDVLTHGELGSKKICLPYT